MKNKYTDPFIVVLILALIISTTAFINKDMKDNFDITDTHIHNLYDKVEELENQAAYLEFELVAYRKENQTYFDSINTNIRLLDASKMSLEQINLLIEKLTEYYQVKTEGK